MQAAVRTAIRHLRRSITAVEGRSSAAAGIACGGGPRVFSSLSAFRSPSDVLDKQEVSDRVIDVLKSVPFVDPSKVSPNADFKNDLKFDMLDNVEVIMAVEEEFAVDIPNSEADKISNTAHLIEYIVAHPQAK
ncbi:hypothetical protein QJS10_CPB13g01610 [Acorus calamus]|uniref:Acyl carrier protein n=1 Tax=Acorus calamus TaxID=4465 RepID=A0AAV9DLC6_ACOCL|nr:hypothetical protein QJS10_CPB13g01610 [Acorus calamus]